MVISRQFKIALLISFFWHLLCIFSVSIVFLSSSQKLRRYSSVYFLGSILSRPVSVATAASTRKKQPVEFPSEADVRMGASHFSQSPFTSLPSRKEAFNPDGLIDVDVPKEPRVSFASFVGLESLAQRDSSLLPKEGLPSVVQNRPSPSRSGGREIIFQPALPKYHEWALSQQNKSAVAIFKIYISADGMVEQPICVQGSGNPEIDAALARHIRRWRFAPVVSPKVQTQTVKISLDFK